MPHIPKKNRLQGQCGYSIKLIDKKTFLECYEKWCKTEITLKEFAARCEIDRNTLRYKLEHFYRYGYMPEEWFYDKDVPGSNDGSKYNMKALRKPYKKWTPENGYED